MTYFVYILKSCARERFYIGCTKDLEKRILQHNAGGTKSTKPYRPWKIIYSESHPNKSQACKREWHLKHPVGYKEKLEIIKNGGVA
jgi:putative endonuclease